MQSREADAPLVEKEAHNSYPIKIIFRVEPVIASSGREDQPLIFIDPECLLVDAEQF